jgi:cytochrome c-type biogenesis protein CcmF
MAQIGSFALLFALALSMYSFGVGMIALFFPGDPLWERLGENDFSIAYILHHSNRDLPRAYKFAALWSGQEGSLLFWALAALAMRLVLRLRYKVDPQLFAYASAIIAAVQVFFLLLVNFAANPFGLVSGTIPADGNGLNPLLQYPEMVIHPPMLYLGYVGVTVPFAFALGALIMKYPGEKWIHITRRWTMVAWLFLTCGIFLGAHWAYSVLGWGGYWGWDPVENASLMPWLVGTAFLHSVMMQEKRGMLKVWNMWLVFATFWLAILGTFLTRSGIISSVHAFAQSSIGDWFAKISELVQGNKVTVGAPFYNRVAIPVALLLLILTALGPLLAWRKTSFESLKRNFLWPCVGAVAVALFLMITPESWGSTLRTETLERYFAISIR